jgi:hypothetical protein
MAEGMDAVTSELIEDTAAYLDRAIDSLSYVLRSPDGHGLSPAAREHLTAVLHTVRAARRGIDGLGTVE